MITITDRVKKMLDESLGLNGRTSMWDMKTRLLGSLPELDSLAVFNLITSIEQTFQIHINDDEINADIFQTIESLCQFIETKM